jgi:hypothetical protein
MAEVYGVKPKRFTKEWWPYFWMYYKWHTIGIVFVVAAVAFTVAQCATKPRYDLTMTYAGHLTFSSEESDEIAADMASYIDDVDGNGESSVEFQTYTFMDQAGSEEYDAAMQAKLDVELYDERSFIFIADKQTLDAMLNNGYYNEVYAQVGQWANEMPSEDRLYMKEDGNAYAVSLKDSAYLNSKGYKTEDMYIVLKNQYQSGKLEPEAFEESKKIANELVK